MKFKEREAFLKDLEDHTIMSDSYRVMCLVERLVQDESVNIFDRGTMVRKLVEAWRAARADIIIPPNPLNAPYVLMRIGNPAHYAFFDNVEQGLSLRDANARAGIATRLINTRTVRVVVNQEDESGKEE